MFELFFINKVSSSVTVGKKEATKNKLHCIFVMCKAIKITTMTWLFRSQRNS